MPDNLKCTVRFFALKYAWHTLGETISCTPIRNICTSNKRAVLSVNLKKDVLPDFQLSRNDPVDSSTTLRKSNDYRKDARPQKNIERPVEAKTITESVKFKRNTKSKKLICERDNLTSEIYQEYNKIAFDSLLPRDLRISWSNRLSSTAGITKMSCLVAGKVKVAEIVLSTKVVDDSDRLRSTLLHEMCHSAAWLVDGERKPPHGPEFWKWASISSAALPGMLVTTCHSYVIHKPYQFMCVDCKHSYGRHSKKGVDLGRQCCGICKGRLNYMGVFDANGKLKSAPLG